MPSETVETPPFQVLVLGGSYAGLAATVNLLDLCHGKPCRFAARYGNAVREEFPRNVPVKVTIVDERDGFCELKIQHAIAVTYSYTLTYIVI